jgi:hypothetical protein
MEIVLDAIGATRSPRGSEAMPMELTKILPSGKKMCVRCDSEVESQAWWLLSFVSNLEARGGSTDEGSRIQIGWSILTVARTQEDFCLHEPRFDGNPFNEKRDDLTVSLRVMGEQTMVLNCFRQPRHSIRFDETIEVVGDCLADNEIFLTRKARSEGISGWSITGPSRRGGAQPKGKNIGSCNAVGAGVQSENCPQKFG